MLRYVRIILIVLFCLALIGAAGLYFYVYTHEDNTPPVFRSGTDLLEISVTDPEEALLGELQAIVAKLEIGKKDQDYSCLKQLFSRADVFGVDLYEAGLGEQIEGMVRELYAGQGAVRATLHKYVSQR